MRNLRLWIALLIIWLVFLFNIERITESIDIISYTYIFVGVVAVITILLPALKTRYFLTLLLIPSIFFLFFKAAVEQGGWYGNLFQGPALPLTVTQLSAIILTGLLARQVNSRLGDILSGIANLTFAHIGTPPPNFNNEQASIYQEIKRARYYNRPLSVLALKVGRNVLNSVIPYTLQEVQQALIKEYALAQIATVLDRTLKDFEIISLRDNDCFIMVLPEVNSADSKVYVERLQTALREQLNISPQVGQASLPDNAVTVEGLIDLAIDNAIRNGVETPSS